MDSRRWIWYTTGTEHTHGQPLSTTVYARAPVHIKNQDQADDNGYQLQSTGNNNNSLVPPTVAPNLV